MLRGAGIRCALATPPRQPSAVHGKLVSERYILSGCCPELLLCGTLDLQSDVRAAAAGGGGNGVYWARRLRLRTENIVVSRRAAPALLLRISNVGYPIGLPD
jgi:hypothetical protein